MELQRVPLDIAKLLWDLLDFSDLVRLYATLNRSVQLLLSHPDALLHLCPDRVMPPADRYFLRSISHVDFLDLGKELCWSPQDVALLQVLNPRCLSLATACFGDITTFIPSEGAAAHQLPMTRFGLLDFALLTPRLESLVCSAEPADFYTYTKSMPEAQQLRLIELRDPLALHWSLPPSLISFACSFGNLSPTDVIHMLPTTLRAVTLEFREFRTTLTWIAHFPQLERLTIVAASMEDVHVDHCPERLPESLTDLHLTDFRSLPLELLLTHVKTSTSLTKLSLSTYVEHAMDEWSQHGDERIPTTIDWNAYLPSSLVSLRLVWTDGSDSSNRCIPTHTD